MTRVSGLGLLDRLPNELLEHIRKCIGYDLEGQVSFLKLSPHTAAFFDTLPTAFWQNLCRHNGFGAIKVQEAADEVCWRDIALECVEHAWSCEHPACGRDRLREIRECWNRNPLTSSWDRARTATPADDLSHGFLTSGLSAISIYTSLKLTTSEHASYPFLCSPDHPNTDELTAKRHPLFLHSFATFPPCEQMQITSPDVGACDVRNDQGCTVGDVLDALISLAQNATITEEEDSFFNMMKLYPDELASRGWNLRPFVFLTPSSEGAWRLSGLLQGYIHERVEGPNRYFVFNWGMTSTPYLDLRGQEIIENMVITS